MGVDEILFLFDGEESTEKSCNSMRPIIRDKMISGLDRTDEALCLAQIDDLNVDLERQVSLPDLFLIDENELLVGVGGDALHDPFRPEPSLLPFVQYDPSASHAPSLSPGTERGEEGHAEEGDESLLAGLAVQQQQRSSESRLQCNRCPYRCVDKEALRRHHSNKHQDARKKCPVCGKKFRERTNVTRHARTVHQLDISNNRISNNLKMFFCDYDGCCYKGNTREDKCRMHKERCHPASERLECGLNRCKVKKKICKFFCFTEEILSRHQMENHPLIL